MPKGEKQSFPKRLLSLLGVTYEKPDETRTLIMNESTDSALAGHGVLPRHLQERYHIIRILGQGGYGVVYLVQDCLIGRLAAMKVLKKSPEQGDAVFEHFQQEARIAGQLDHENIVVIYNVEYTGDIACIVMEYLSEGSLASILAEKERYNPYEAVCVMCGILDGLSASHRIRVIHRDIKPENILFDPKGRPKISDFGVAHLPQEEGGVLSDKEFSPVGTPHYMAPEQIRGDEDIDSRADLYSCGVILYEMLTGQKPYKIKKGLRQKDILAIVASGDYPAISEFRDDISDDLLSVVQRLLKYDRAERYQSSMAALQDLKALEEQLNVEKEGMFPDRIVTSPAHLLEDVMRILLQDGIMAPAERREINRRADRLKVSKSETRAIEMKIRQEMGLPSLDSLEAYESTYQLMGGNWDSLSEEEQEFLKKTSERLGLQDIERQMIEKDANESREGE